VSQRDIVLDFARKKAHGEHEVTGASTKTTGLLVFFAPNQCGKNQRPADRLGCFEQ
jgi:hypothetical protein